jgi:predicted Zn-dependent peptidase
MRSLAITVENFENQRATVKEERRLGVDNRPYGRAFSDGPTLPFDSTACFGYAHTVIGSMADLDAAEVRDVQAFFDQYYAPNNATLAVVGDFDPAAARALIEQYFGDVPRGTDPPPVRCEVQYAPGPARRVFADPLASLPAVLVLYRIPGHTDPATRPLQLLRTILGDGESSRVHRALVREAQSALQAGAYVDSRRGPGTFLLYAIANRGVAAETLAAQLAAQVARIAAEGVTPEELTRARNDHRASEIFGRQTTLDVSQQLQHYAHYHDRIADIADDLDRYMAVTGDDLKAAAARYLIEPNSYTIVVEPAAAAGGAQ